MEHLIDEHSDIIIALIAGLPGILVFIYQVVAFLQARKKNKAETRKIEAETDLIFSQVSERYAAQVNTLQQQITKLQSGDENSGKRIATLEAKVMGLQSDNQLLKNRVVELEAGIGILTNQIVSLGHQPNWRRRTTGQLPSEGAHASSE